MNLQFSKIPTGWCVIDDDRYDGPESDHIGAGATRGEALVDLLESTDPVLLDEVEDALL